MTETNIKEYIVCLNGGSGVIFQPAEPGISYILTAKHVLDDIDTQFAGKFQVAYYIPGQDNLHSMEPLKQVAGLNYFPHPDAQMDIAIIKVPKIPGAEKLLFAEDMAMDPNKYWLFSFPVQRRQVPITLDCIREDPHTEILDDKADKKREAQSGNNQNFNELEGASGGGYFRIEHGYVLLMGIQNKMVTGQELLGRILFTPVKYFGDIFKQYPDQLEDFVPAYMKCFSFLQSSAFNIAAGLEDGETVGNLTDILRAKTQELIHASFTPVWIRNSMKKRLQLVGQDHTITCLKELWIYWLELLIILNLVKKGKLTTGDFEQTMEDYRLFYSPTENDFWSAHLEDLAFTDYNGLKSNGLVVVASKNAPARQVYQFKADKIIQIDRVKKKYDKYVLTQPDSSSNLDLQIDVAAEFPFTKFRFIHISAFKNHAISEQYMEFAGFDIQQMVNKLIQLYEQLLSS